MKGADLMIMEPKVTSPWDRGSKLPLPSLTASLSCQNNVSEPCKIDELPLGLQKLLLEMDSRTFCFGVIASDWTRLVMLAHWLLLNELGVALWFLMGSCP